MRNSAARTLPPPRVLRELTTRIAWGESAKAFPDSAAVILLPHHAQMAGGDAYISWSSSSDAPTELSDEAASSTFSGLAVPSGTQVRWSVTERGVTERGASTVTWDGLTVVVSGEWPNAAAPRYVPRAKTVAEDGSRALFELVASLEDHVAEALAQANRYVARELEGRTGDEAEGWSETFNHGAVDRIALDVLSSELLYGRDDENESTVIRMAKSAALTNINNQPLGSWWSINVRARAEERIRRHIGDPHIGPKVRRFTAAYLRNHGDASLEELLRQYRAANPRDMAGRDRLVAALSAGKTVDATSTSLSLFHNIAEDAEPERGSE